MNEEKTTFTFKEQTGFGIARSDIELTTGKVIVNDIEITSVEDWERVTNSLIKLQNNWNELKKFNEEQLKQFQKQLANAKTDLEDRINYTRCYCYSRNLEKMQELEGNNE